MKDPERVRRTCGKSPLVRSASAILLAISLAATSRAQDASALLQQARELEATRPGESLRLVEALLTRGSDHAEVHILHGRLLLQLGDLEAARAALGKAGDLVAAMAQEIDALRRGIDDASSRPATGEPSDIEAQFREADSLREGNPVEAAQKFTHLAVTASDDHGERAKGSLAAIIPDLAKEAASLDATDPARADEIRDVAFAATQTFDTPAESERFVAAIETLAENGDDSVKLRAGAVVVAKTENDVVSSNEADARGDYPASRRWRGTAKKQLEMFPALSNDLDLQRRAHEALCKLADREAQRRALEEYLAWAKDLVAQIEQALRDHDVATDSLRDQLAKVSVFLVERGHHEHRAELGRHLASVDSANGGEVLAQLGQSAKDFDQRAREQERRGRVEEAATLFTAAFWNDPMVTGLGLKAAELLTQLGQNVQAMRIYQHLRQLGDADIADEVTEGIEGLRRWATEQFLNRRAKFEELLQGKRYDEAARFVSDPFVLVDQAKFGLAIESIDGDPQRAGDLLREIGMGLAKGEFVDVTQSRAIEPGKEFVSALGLKFVPIAGDPALWVSETQVTEAQVLEYSIGLNRFQDHGCAMISWNNAIMFSLYLTRLERDARRLPSNYSFSLPTFAEWDSIRRLEGPRGLQPGQSRPVVEWCLPDSSGESVCNVRDVETGTADFFDPAGNPHGAGNVLFRLVLVARPEMEPPYK